VRYERLEVGGRRLEVGSVGAILIAHKKESHSQKELKTKNEY